MKTGGLGEQVKAWRQAKGLSVPEFARAVGTSRQNIENLEGGRLRRHPFYLPALARAMGTSVEALLAGLPADPVRGAPDVESALLAVRDDLAVLVPADAQAFGDELLGLCARIAERAEQMRARDRGAAREPLPAPLAQIAAELDALPPEARGEAAARAVTAITQVVMRGRMPAPAAGAPAPTPAGTPTPRQRVRRR